MASRQAVQRWQGLEEPRWVHRDPWLHEGHATPLETVLTPQPAIARQERSRIVLRPTRGSWCRSAETGCQPTLRRCLLLT